MCTRRACLNEGTRARHRLKGEKNDQRWHSSSGIVSVFFFFYLFTSFQYCFPTLGKHTCLRKCLGGREQFEYYLDIFTAAYIPYTQCRLCFFLLFRHLAHLFIATCMWPGKKAMSSLCGLVCFLFFCRFYYCTHCLLNELSKWCTVEWFQWARLRIEIVFQYVGWELW